MLNARMSIPASKGIFLALQSKLKGNLLFPLNKSLGIWIAMHQPGREMVCPAVMCYELLGKSRSNPMGI
jgi:hypothetical protein